MKIAGFNISKKALIIGVIIVAIIALVSYINKKQADAELAARIAAATANNAQPQVQEEIDLHEQIQAQLRETFGNPPEGFEWGFNGELVPLSDDELTCEDVVYTFIRSLSMLDFSTAERYSMDSNVINMYKNYYNVTTTAITDYYDNFLRKQFKTSIASLEINSISDTAVFADGTQYVTLNISALDLTDKDFWLNDKDELYNTMRLYDETEEDDVKKEQYLYDYIYEKYLSEDFKKKEYTIELVVSKGNGEGWLVSNDRELCAKLQYEQGVDTAQYILSSYNEWYQTTLLEEQQEALKKQQEQIQEQLELSNQSGSLN